MLSVYLDESGTHMDGSPIVVVAGLVAPPRQWERLTTEWQKILDSEGLADFHMKDCAHLKNEFAPQRRCQAFQERGGHRRRNRGGSPASSFCFSDFQRAGARSRSEGSPGKGAVAGAGRVSALEKANPFPLPPRSNARSRPPSAELKTRTAATGPRRPGGASSCLRIYGSALCPEGIPQSCRFTI